MGKSRIKTRTTYFIATPNGKLHQLNMSLMVIIALALVWAAGFFAKQSYTLNQRLIAEEQEYYSRFTAFNINREQMERDLKVCEQKKAEIGNLLYFSTDSRKTTDEK